MAQRKPIEITPENLIEVLTNLRIEKGLTQSQLGELSGIDFRALSRMEKGQLPNVTNLHKIVSALGRKVIIK